MARITVEDCLQQENNRFSLVLLSSKRTKQLLNGSRVLISDQRGNKAVVTSLREIAAGQVRFMTEEEKLQREREIAEQAEREAQAQAAIKPATPLSEVGASLFHSDTPPSPAGTDSNGHTNGSSDKTSGADNEE